MRRKKQPRYVIRWSHNCYYHPRKQMLFGEEGKKLARRYTLGEAKKIVKNWGNAWPNAKIEEVDND